jgi:diacylglycerol kinase family enzyme
MRARLIINPQAGRGAGKRLGGAIDRRLAALGLDCVTSWSEASGDVARQVEAACRVGDDPIIVAGGDGTVCEGVNGVMRAGRASASWPSERATISSRPLACRGIGAPRASAS